MNDQTEAPNKGALIEQVLDNGFLNFKSREQIERLGLIRQVTDGDLSYWEWDRDVLIMLDADQLQQLLNGECPDTIDTGEVITAQHFIAERDDYNARGDLRQRVLDLLEVDVAPCFESRQERHGQIVADWYHFDISGVLTEDKFQEQLDEGIKKLAEQINLHKNPFQSVRFHHFPPTQYGMAYVDWCGREETDCDGEPFDFDIRVIVQFGNFVEPTTKITTAGFHFFLTTLVEFDEEADWEPIK